MVCATLDIDDDVLTSARMRAEALEILAVLDEWMHPGRHTTCWTVREPVSGGGT